MLPCPTPGKGDPSVVWLTLAVALLTNATVTLFYAHCVVTSILNLPPLRWTPQAAFLENSSCDSEILFYIKEF